MGIENNKIQSPASRYHHSDAKDPLTEQMGTSFLDDER